MTSRVVPIKPQFCLPDRNAQYSCLSFVIPRQLAAIVLLVQMLLRQ